LEHGIRHDLAASQQAILESVERCFEIIEALSTFQRQRVAPEASFFSGCSHFGQDSLSAGHSPEVSINRAKAFPGEPRTLW
jgi:hypothetical protein